MTKIKLGHGSGGIQTTELINKVFYKHFANQILLQGNDYALLPEIDGRIVVSTDSFVVNPLFFPGGDIGKLAVCGTVNDLAMSGAKPRYLTTGFVIEEGLEMRILEMVVSSMAETAQQAGVLIVAGDTKVVERGQADKLYINTTGVGVVRTDYFTEEEVQCPAGNRARPGDQIFINGTIGEHELAVLLARENYGFWQQIKSDCTSLNGLINSVMQECTGVRVLRDPSRGGLAQVLNEIAQQSGVGLQLNEVKIPISDAVRAVCSLLGFDPLYLANEGKVVLIVAADEGEKVMALMKEHPLGRKAALIGGVIGGKQMVRVKTAIGGNRILRPQSVSQLPRIC